MSSMSTRAQIHRFLNRPETWGQSSLQFCFYENGSDLYRGDETQPEKSPLRSACRESREIWLQNYIIPDIQLSHEWEIKLGVKPHAFGNCRSTQCVRLQARYPVRSHMIPHEHNYYLNSDGRLFYVVVRGFIDMNRDTLIMDPVVFSLVNGDLGLDLNISKLRSIAYTSSIEYRPLWKPPGNNGRYEVVEGTRLLISDRGSGYHAADPDINKTFVDLQAGNARNALVRIEEPEDLPADKEKNIASKDMWSFITQCCPQISSIQYILLGETNTAIVNWGDPGNPPGRKVGWEIHEHHLLPLYPSVREIIMSPINAPRYNWIWGRGTNFGLPIVGIQSHFNNRLNHGLQLEKDFQDYIKEHEDSGNRHFWHGLKFQVCALGDAVRLNVSAITRGQGGTQVLMGEDFFDVESEGEIPFEFTSGKVSPSSSSSSLPSYPEERGSENSISQNKEQKVEVPMREDERCFLHLEKGVYLHWDPTGAPIQVTRNVYAGVQALFERAWQDHLDYETNRRNEAYLECECHLGYRSSLVHGLDFEEFFSSVSQF
ncbi:uncharacterized protein EAE98_001529 [Botrytis deweyae]|uniref:Cryptic loci regulator 2 C-terminal domain-containing protein n=1 Tax=Botrytis deweyae TaxID=2478750 RepID=A0ABQ7IY46_9HELO|nr:uncharacterized protein EAE98_001529 [Botrytis deweyae]KAF7937215.1 hypothetical protein EAE98_001529 [Botrytis deweyae]